MAFYMLNVLILVSEIQGSGIHDGQHIFTAGPPITWSEASIDAFSEALRADE